MLIEGLTSGCLRGPSSVRCSALIPIDLLLYLTTDCLFRIFCQDIGSLAEPGETLSSAS